jgi:hypothetical protein
MNIGDRVKVNIIKPETYARGAFECLNGKTGVVEDEKGLILVRFDTCAKSWHSYQSPVSGFHFHRSELIEIGEEVKNDRA